jgi:hypothetical protein
VLRLLVLQRASIGSINDGPISVYQNRIINGDMRVDQRNNGLGHYIFFYIFSGQTYTVDRWDGTKNGGNGKAFTIQRSGTAPVGFRFFIIYSNYCIIYRKW